MLKVYIMKILLYRAYKSAIARETPLADFSGKNSKNEPL